MSRSHQKLPKMIIYHADKIKLTDEELSEYQSRLELYKQTYDVAAYEKKDGKDTRLMSVSKGGVLGIAHIEGLHIAHKLQEGQRPDVVVLHVRGNSEKTQEVDSQLIEDLDSFESKGLKAAAFVHNPRGVQGSSGTIYNKVDLVNDLNALYQEVTKKYPGVPIVVKAHSLGTAIASEWIVNKNPKGIALLWLGRGFSYTASVVTGKQDSILDTSLQAVLAAFNWRLNTAEKIQSILNKDIPIIAIDAEGDRVIGKPAQLAHYLVSHGQIPNLTIPGENSKSLEELAEELYFRTNVKMNYAAVGTPILNIIEDMNNYPEDAGRQFVDIAKQWGLTDEILKKFELYKTVLEDLQLEIVDTENHIVKLLDERLALFETESGTPADSFPLTEFIDCAHAYADMTNDAHNVNLNELQNKNGLSAQQFFVDQSVRSVALLQQQKKEREQRTAESKKAEEEMQKVEEAESIPEKDFEEIKQKASTPVETLILNIKIATPANSVISGISSDFLKQITDVKDLNNLMLALQQASYKTGGLFSRSTSPYKKQADLILMCFADLVGGNKSSPIHQAAGLGLNPIIHELAKRRVNVNQVDDMGNTPLFKAVQQGQADTVLFLIKEGADLNIGAKPGKKERQVPLVLAFDKALVWLTDLSKMSSKEKFLQHAAIIGYLLENAKDSQETKESIKSVLNHLTDFLKGLTIDEAQYRAYKNYIFRPLSSSNLLSFEQKLAIPVPAKPNPVMEQQEETYVRRRGFDRRGS